MSYNLRKMRIYLASFFKCVIHSYIYLSPMLKIGNLFVLFTLKISTMITNIECKKKNAHSGRKMKIMRQSSIRTEGPCDLQSSGHFLTIGCVAKWPPSCGLWPPSGQKVTMQFFCSMYFISMTFV